jgi:hypothetical protein
MTLRQDLRLFAVPNRPVVEPGHRPSQGAAPGRSNRQFRAHFGRDDRAQKLDRTQDHRLRLAANRHLHESAVVAKNLVLSENFGDGLVRRSDHQMAARATALDELRSRQGRPAALDSSAVTPPAAPTKPNSIELLPAFKRKPSASRLPCAPWAQRLCPEARSSAGPRLAAGCRPTSA